MDDIELLITKNQNFIYKLAHYYGKGENIEDLFQVGCMGFIKAYNNFDASYGAKLTTFAYPYIVGEIKSYLREMSPIKKSKDLMKLSLQIAKAKMLLTQKLMREPSIKELALFLEIDESTINYGLMNFNSISLDKENEVGNLYDVIADKKIDYDLLIMVKEEFDNLKEPDRTIMIKRYLEDHTQMEVANEVGVNQAFVSRCENKTLKLIRNKIS